MKTSPHRRKHRRRAFRRLFWLLVLMALLVARVYEQIILHTGNRLKLGDILGLVKSK